jgi:hypothetical protein
MLSGLIGVPLGSIVAQRLRARYPTIDPLICAIGLLISSPLLFAASLCASVNSNACYTLIFFGEVFLNLNWSIVADMLLVSIVERLVICRAEPQCSCCEHFTSPVAVCGCAHETVYSRGVPNTCITCLWRCRQPISGWTGESCSSIAPLRATVYTQHPAC